MGWDVSDAEAKDQRLIVGLRNMTPLTRAWEAEIKASVERNFEGETAGGIEFHPLADSTIEDRITKGYDPGPILTRSGEMRRAIDGDHDRTSAEAGPDGSVPYAKFHPDGTRFMPARDFLTLDDEGHDNADTLLDEYLRTIE